MNMSLKKILAMGIAISVALNAGHLDYAHSGRTDSSGGHKDNRNKSGLGYYHYHHGYGPHLHSGGNCPYEVSKADELPSAENNKTIELVSKHEHGSMPNFKIKVSGSELDQSRSKYPLIVYNNITYIPMTWSMCQTLGITSEYSEKTGLHLTTEQFKSDTYIPLQSETESGLSEVDIEDTDISIWINDD